MGAAFEQHTGHMAPSHAAFLRHWLQLINLEEGGSIARRSEIWVLSGTLTVGGSSQLCFGLSVPC